MACAGVIPGVSAFPGYNIQPFHLGWLFKEPVLVSEIDNGTASPVAFTAADFDYHDPATAAEMAKITLPGIAGFRIDYPLNAPGQND